MNRPSAIRAFTVRVQLPEPLAPLLDVAMNLRWSWDPRSKDLFRWVDPKAWTAARHDPMRLLGMVGPRRLEALASDAAFMDFLDEVHQALVHYTEAPKWFQGRDESPLTSVAYFSPEFGISEALPQYSGGLGVLAGDHMKSASGLGVPIIGVGLMYREGYFQQELSGDGWQKEAYSDLDPHAMALRPVDGARVEVDLAGRTLVARIWKAEIGRIPLYLLDSDVEENEPSLRGVTDRLYGGDPEVHRIEQEILLGMGGVEALRRVGEDPDVYHMNEGHAGFLALSRLAYFMTEQGLGFADAVEAVRAATVFTTHTPVPVGIDRFPRPLMEKYFLGWADGLGIDFEDLMSLGHGPGDDAQEPFNMAVMALSLAAHVNGVSQLHGEVTRGMFSNLWPGVPTEEVPISHVTNGVHPRTWVSPEMEALFERQILPQWDEADEERWAEIHEASDDELWRVHAGNRERMVTFIRRRLREAAIARGAGEADVSWCDEVFDPSLMTIGWARRFAEYKRPNLLLSDLDRLKALLLSPVRPVQVVFAGKAHPADEMGKEMIRQIVQFSEREEVRHRIAFVEGYDIGVARLLYQGCDLWLSTSRRPFEACGTSGMKAALNGALICATRDGWWAEMFDPEIGWAIAGAESYEDLAERDAVEAASLFDLLERQIVPLFYERTDGDVPQGWVDRIKASMATLAPKVSASRMVRDYVETLYEPAARRSRILSTDGYGRAREIAVWKRRVREKWHQVHIGGVEGDVSVMKLGDEREVLATVTLGELQARDVEVQLLHGPVGPGNEMPDAAIEVMSLAHEEEGGARYQKSFTCDRAGRYGYTVRVVPSHPDLTGPFEVPCVTWA